MKIPTYEWHLAKGAEFEDFFGCKIPSHYGAVEQEYWAIRKSVGLRDVSHFGKIRVSGRDRHRFLNGMLSNDIKTLEAGMGTRTLFLDVKGHIQADMKVYSFPDHILMVMQHYVRQKIMAGLDRYIISEDVKMNDVTDEIAMFQILGPQSEAFLRARGVDEIPSEPYSFRAVRIAEIPVHLIFLETGFALLSSQSDAVLLLNQMDIPLTGMRAFDLFRIESGLPLLQKDMDETNFPQEARLHAALNFQKGCYLGQEVMARIDAQGHVNKLLVGIVSQQPVHGGDRIYKSQKEIGKITSAAFSLLLNQHIALGYVRREFAKDGETVEAGEPPAAAVVKQLPFAGFH